MESETNPARSRSGPGGAKKSPPPIEEDSGAELTAEDPILPFQESSPRRNGSRMETFRVWMHSSQKWIYAFLLISLFGPAIYRAADTQPGLRDILQTYYQKGGPAENAAYSIGEFRKSNRELEQTYLAFHSLISGATNSATHRDVKSDKGSHADSRKQSGNDAHSDAGRNKESRNDASSDTTRHTESSNDAHSDTARHTESSNDAGSNAGRSKESSRGSESLDWPGYRRFARSSFEVDLLAKRALEKGLLSDPQVRRFLRHRLKASLARVYVLHSLQQHPPLRNSGSPQPDEPRRTDSSFSQTRSDISNRIRRRWRQLVRQAIANPGTAMPGDFR